MPSPRYVGDAQLGSVPSGLADAYRKAVETLTRNGRPATIHVELEIGEYVDVWGLCKPQLRQEGEPLLPTQYREDVHLFDGIAADLGASLDSRAKEKKVRRNGAVSLGADEAWNVSEGGRIIGTLASKSYKRLHELMRAGLPLEVVITIHRRPGRPLSTINDIDHVDDAVKIQTRHVSNVVGYGYPDYAPASSR